MVTGWLILRRAREARECLIARERGALAKTLASEPAPPAALFNAQEPAAGSRQTAAALLRKTADLHAMRTAWHRFCLLAADDPVWAQGEEPNVRRLFERWMHNLVSIRQITKSFEARGAPLRGARQLDRCILELDRMIRRVSDWPLSQEQLLAEVPILFGGRRAILWRNLSHLLTSWPRYETAAPVLLSAGAFTAAVCGACSLAPLWAGFLAGYLGMALLVSVAYVANP